MNHLQKKENRTVKGSATIEMAYLMPLIFLVFLLLVYSVFYYHDKNILNGIAYEGAVVGSQQIQNEQTDLSNIEGFIQQQSKNKVILMTQVRSSVTCSKHDVTVHIYARHKGMKLQIQQKAAIIEPEKFIRNIRKVKEGV